MKYFWVIFLSLFLNYAFTQKKSIESFATAFSNSQIKKGDTLVFGKGRLLDQYNQPIGTYKCFLPLSFNNTSDKEGKLIVIEELLQASSGAINAKVHLTTETEKESFKIINLEAAFQEKEIVHISEAMPFFANKANVQRYNYYSLLSKPQFVNLLFPLKNWTSYAAVLKL